MTDYEKLGVFYLGRVHDPEKGTTDEPILYDAKDLTTHAVCVGMTGSGKTGLGVTLLEEAAIDGIPVLAIDPKGDLGNALLTFPQLRSADFRPWIDEGDAARKGRTAEEHAQWTADLWRKGLADWGQDGQRIQRFRDAVDTTIFTPGSRAGTPINVLRSFAAPPAAVAQDADALRDRVNTTATGLLSLLGIDADPLRSREHILLANLLHQAWTEGRNLDLASIIRGIQDPPFDRVGVFDLESFYPSKERFELAMTLNNLLASPGFSVWTEGEPLDVARLLYTPEGRPRLSILSIAHLSDAERMFFVTLLLNEVLSWIRTQPGSRSLRAMVYMDEIFGYFPPTANPPSKQPMLTLLKQARAFGVGFVLATQNPVDLDYKGLANTGTWFLGRLQTERDKLRVIDGLEGASSAAGGNFNRAHVERLLSGLGSRVFLMHNVHENEPVLFHTRWVLSYLAGPMTREQIKRLSAEHAGQAGALPHAAAAGAAAASGPASAASGPASAVSERPVVPPAIPETFLPESKPGTSRGRLVYRPALLGVATLHFADSRAGVDKWEKAALLVALLDDMPLSPWEDAAALEQAPSDTQDEPSEGAEFAKLPKGATDSKTFKRWSKMLVSHLYQTRSVSQWQCKALKAKSEPGEAMGDFRARLRDQVRERRDLKLEKMRTRYGPKLQRLQDQIRTAEHKVGKERSQYQEQKRSSALSWGTTIMGALFGRKSGTVSKAATAARRTGRLSREKDDIGRAEEKLDVLEQRLTDMQAEFEAELEEVREENQLDDFPITEKRIRPRKSDLSVDQLALTWTPWRVDANGIAEPTHAS